MKNVTLSSMEQKTKKDRTETVLIGGGGGDTAPYSHIVPLSAYSSSYMQYLCYLFM